MTGSRDSEENLKKEKIDRQLAGSHLPLHVMNIWKEHNKRVIFNMTDGIEQKIDKLTVMMGKLVTDNEGKTDSSNHEFISPIEVDDRQDAITNREDFRTGLGPTTIGTIHIEEDQGMDKTIEVGQDMILIIEVIMETI